MLTTRFEEGHQRHEDPQEPRSATDDRSTVQTVGRVEARRQAPRQRWRHHRQAAETAQVRSRGEEVGCGRLPRVV